MELGAWLASKWSLLGEERLTCDRLDLIKRIDSIHPSSGQIYLLNWRLRLFTRVFAFTVRAPLDHRRGLHDRRGLRNWFPIQGDLSEADLKILITSCSCTMETGETEIINKSGYPPWFNLIVKSARRAKLSYLPIFAWCRTLYVWQPYLS